MRLVRLGENGVEEGRASDMVREFKRSSVTAACGERSERMS